MRKDDWRYEEAAPIDQTFIAKYLQPEEEKGRKTTRMQPLMKVLSEKNLKVLASGGKQSCRTPRLIKKVADKENMQVNTQDVAGYRGKSVEKSDLKQPLIQKPPQSLSTAQCHRKIPSYLSGTLTAASLLS